MCHPLARLALAFAVMAMTIGSASALTDRDSLVVGDDPEQFQLVGIGRADLTIGDGEVRLSGRPFGYFATKGSFSGYDLEFEWRYDRPEGMDADAEARFRGNGGVLLHVDGPPRVWPRCIQVQLAQADPGAIFAMGEDAGIDAHIDVDVQRKAMRPVGQWNRAEIACDAGAIVCRINGEEVSRGTAAKPDRGPIGWQSEGTPLRLRNIRLRPRQGR